MFAKAYTDNCCLVLRGHFPKCMVKSLKTVQALTLHCTTTIPISNKPLHSILVEDFNCYFPRIRFVNPRSPPPCVKNVQHFFLKLCTRKIILHKKVLG